jgi:hypothetical protein
MSERNDFNQKVISEFRTNEGKVGGQMKGVPLLLLTTTGRTDRKAVYETASIYKGWREDRGDCVVRRVAAPSRVVRQSSQESGGDDRDREREVSGARNREKRQRLFDAQA